jgi:hypothetical protein
MLCHIRPRQQGRWAGTTESPIDDILVPLVGKIWRGVVLFRAVSSSGQLLRFRDFHKADLSQDSRPIEGNRDRFRFSVADRLCGR